MRPAGVAALLAVAAALGILVAVWADAARRAGARRHDENAIREVASLLPSGDLAWNGGARWVRFVSLEEPSAASADGPLMPDPDPAGVLVSPPGNHGAITR